MNSTFSLVSCMTSPFPTLRTAINPHYEVPALLSNWFVVAIDPTNFSYYDESAQAIDETNYEVLQGAVNASTVDSRYSMTSDEEAEALVDGAVFFDSTFGDGNSYLVVDPSNLDLVETFSQFLGALENYPLLDESAYSEREYDAWVEFVMTGGMQSDTTRALRDLGVDEVTIDSIDEAWESIAPQAASKLDYFNGFEGSCSPAFEDVVMQVIVEALVGVVTA